MRNRFSLAATLVAALLASMPTGARAATPCGQSPADPKADANAKALLCYLSGNTYISGQTDMPDANRIKDLTGRFPAIVAFDFYGYLDGNAAANAKNTQAAIDFGKNHNGIVAFQWHWKAPIPGNRGEYYTDWDYPSALKDPNSQLIKDIDLVAGELKKIADAGVPVLFRPLHECNNNFMWWQKKGTGNYKALWKLLFDRMAAAGVHNLVWNFNGMASGQGTAMGDWYPGDNLVDVISSDYYQSWSDYESMKRMGTNKTLGVAETWFALDPAKDPPFSHGVVWASRDWGDSKHGGTPAVENAWKKAMADSKTISVEQVDLDAYRTVGVSGDGTEGLSGALRVRRSEGAMLDVRVDGEFELSLRDLRGNVVLRERGIGHRSVSVASLRPGVYFASLRETSGLSSARLLL